MAELHSAFWYNCDACGADNWVRALEGGIDLSALAAAEYQDDAHLIAMHPVEDTPDYTGYEALVQRVVVCPRYVTCATCKHVALAQIWYRDEEGEEAYEDDIDDDDETEEDD